MAFNFSSARLTLPTSVSFCRENAAIEVSAWIYPRSLGGGSLGRILFRRNSSGAGTGFNINMMATNTIGFGLDGGTKLDLQAANGSITMNTWQHFCFSWDGSTTAANAHIYINGVETSYKVQTNGSSPDPTSGQAVIIGDRADFTRAFDGLMAEFAIWSVQLSSDERNALKNGVSPDAIRPQSRVFYPPMLRDVIDTHGTAITNTGVTAAAHPRVYA